MTTKIKSGVISDNAITSAHISSGAISSAHLTGIDTDAVSEGSSNLYFTTARVDSHLSGGTGVTYSSGAISIGQSVATTDSPTFANLTLTGNLNITGDVNSVSVTDLDITDKTITVGVGGTASANDGAGLVVDGASASILWDNSNTSWDFNNPIESSRVNTNTVNNVGNSANIIYRSSTNTIVGNNASALVVQDAGNVGIGTDSPDCILHIEGGGVASLRFDNIGPSSNSALRISRDDTTISNNPLGYLEFGGKDNTGNVDTAHAYIGAIAGSHSAGSNPTDLTFGTTPSSSSTISERMRIDSSGNVGIGTTSPARKLDVVGVIGATGVSTPEFELVPTGSVGNADIRFDGTTLDIRSNSSSASLLLSTYSTERMRIDSSGNVGINDNNPSQKLSVSGTSSVVPARFTAAGNTNTLEVFGNSTTDTSNGLLVSSGTSANDYAAYFRKVDGTTPIMMIEGTGNVGIGTTSPDGELHVLGSGGGNGDIYVERTSGAKIHLQAQSAAGKIGTFSNHDLGLNTNGATRVTIDTNGKVGIGTSDPSEMLHIVGGGSGPEIRLANSTSSHYIRAYDDNWNFLANASVTAMTIRNDGDVEFGEDVDLTGGRIKVTNSGTDAYFFEGVRDGGNVTLRMYDNNNNLYIDSYTNMSFRCNQTGGGSGGQIYLTGGDVNIGSSTDSARYLIFDKSSSGENGIIFRNASSNKGKIFLDSDEFMQFYINNSTNAMTIRETKGQIDAAAAGGRFSGYVQDMVHIGADKSEVTRYGNSGKTWTDGGSSNYAGYVYGQETFLPGVFMPYSPNQVYRLSASIYQITNGTGYNESRHYIGVVGYDENFSFLSVDAIGTYQYNMASNTGLAAGNALEVDVTIKGWQGSGGSDGNKMDEGTVYIRPLILFNYQRPGGTAALTGFTMMPAGTISDNDSNAGTNY